MTITTYTTFAAALAALSVTGVTRKLTAPPTSIATADLPAMWPGLPRGEEPSMTFKTAGGWPTLICDLIVAIEPVGQNTQGANYTATLAIMDALSTALRASSIGRASLTWTINANVQVIVSDTTYWAVVCTVTGY